MPRPIELIVACSENRIIGRAGRLPFDIPEDKKWFHDQTANQTVVLGRICFETWPRVMRDGRHPVVISSQPAHIQKITAQKAASAPGADSNLQAARVPAGEPSIAANVSDALALAQKLPGRIMVCGGQRIYEETLPLADRILLTLVHAQVEGDTWFPEWRHIAWRESWKREGADTNYRYTFSILERVR
ncbi:dihydrofolate reductase [Oleiharenicola lentus]|jgi:dihydrofolate reductase|uniref:dihydrofolate reductase n=1 Tax=Oleiharenicola lentus TaxID=2508720 RepID=A0A4Q1CBX1_9BACT|nr:dihydrofolate reductase [Oleiharenicola lentus]RXK56605.1 dihydrofolate reductase [Oleiharenicola lentus]